MREPDIGPPWTVFWRPVKDAPGRNIPQSLSSALHVGMPVLPLLQAMLGQVLSHQHVHIPLPGPIMEKAKSSL